LAAEAQTMLLGRVGAMLGLEADRFHELLDANVTGRAAVESLEAALKQFEKAR